MNVRLEAFDGVPIGVLLQRLEGDLQREPAKIFHRFGRRDVQMHVEDAAEGTLLCLQATT